MQKLIDKFGPKLSRRVTQVLGGLLILVATLVQFQNCAKSTDATDSGSEQSSAQSKAALGGSADASGNGQVHLIDGPQADQSVSFVNRELELATTVSTINLNGLCALAQNGALPNVELNGPGGAVLQHNSVNCEMGAFAAQLNGLAQLDCTQNYDLIVMLGVRGKDTITVTRRCQPIGSKPSPEIAAQVLPTQSQATCSTELLPAVPGSGQKCQAVCYDQQGIVQYKQDLALNGCSDLGNPSGQ